MKKKLPTPRQLPSGSWRVQLMVDGKRISVVDENPSVAQAKAMAMSAGLLEQKKEKAKTGKTLREAIENYIKDREGVLSPSTIRGYEKIKKCRFQSLMDMDTGKINKAVIQRAISAEAKEVSAKTVYNAYGLIRPVLKECGIDVFGVKLPQRIKPRKQYLQPEDVGKLIKIVQGDRCEIEILLAVWLGMRRSEIVGLCWDCVDFEQSTITVKRSVVHNKDQKLVLKDFPKNESSQRVIRCPAYIMDKIKGKHTDGVRGQVFDTYIDTLSKHVHRACQEAGIIDTSLHGLRHTNAAIMKSTGVRDLHAMGRGGWKTEAMYKQTYSYVFDEDLIEDDEKIDKKFEELIQKAKITVQKPIVRARKKTTAE